MELSQLLKDYQDKVPTMILQKKYNLSWKKLTIILKENNVYKKANSLYIKDSSLEYIKENYLIMSNKELAKNLNINEDWLRVLAKKLNLPVKGSGWKYNKTLMTLDKTTNEFNYFLGWMASDGNVSKNFQQVSLSTIDKEIVDKFKIIFPSASVYVSVKEINKDIYKLFIGSIKFAKYLNSIGITPNKSKTLNVSKELWNFHFVRGFFEGDGHVRKTSLKDKNIRYCVGFVCASEIFISDLQDFLQKNKIESKLTKEKSFFRLNINGKENVKMFYKQVYKNCDKWYLLRKKQILDQLFSNE